MGDDTDYQRLGCNSAAVKQHASENAISNSRENISPVYGRRYLFLTYLCVRQLGQSSRYRENSPPFYDNSGVDGETLEINTCTLIGRR